MTSSDSEARLIPARELGEWQDWIAALDQEFFESVRPGGRGISVGRYGYAVHPKQVSDHDQLSVCEPPPSDLAYVLCRYVIEHMDDPWSYLRFWTRYLRPGGALVLFINPHPWEWIDPYACWQTEDILLHLGFGPPIQRQPMEHECGDGMVAAKRRLIPEGMVVHAAAVERNGRAILIDAPNGSGKTTLVLQLIASGWRFLADSFTLVDDHLVAHPGIPVMSVRPGTDRFAPGIADLLRRHPAGKDPSGRFSEEGHAHPDDWKHRFAAAEIPGVEFGAAAPVAAIIFPRVSAGAPVSVIPISEDAARARLESNYLPYYGHNLPAERERRYRIVEGLLGRASLAELALGAGDPAAALGDVISYRRPAVQSAAATRGEGMLDAHQAATTASFLNLPEAAKCLIVNGDDAGLCHSVNQAVINALEHGLMTSASLMVPSPWFLEMAHYAREHPEVSCGVHLTLTCEWDYYRWGPVAGPSSAPGLCSSDGSMWRSHELLRAHASPEEIRIEARAQVERCLRLGVGVTHLDCHMDALLYHEPFGLVLLDLAEEYRLPVRLFPRSLCQSLGLPDLRLEASRRRVLFPDELILPDPSQPLAVFWPAALRELQPGLALAFIHVGLGGDELMTITAGDDRQEEYRLFGPDRGVEDLLQRHRISLIDHRPLFEAQKRALVSND